MKKKLILGAFVLCNVATALAGGYLTNTNQSARFGRLMAVDAIYKSADAAYYNPAGTAFLAEGFHFTLSNQSAFQKRKIKTDYAPFAYNAENLGVSTKNYLGEASAPIIPSVQGVWRKGKWALSGGFAISGGGGKATFNDGLGSFESLVSTLPIVMNAVGVTQYSFDSYLSGSSLIYGAQIGGTYKVSDMFSVHAGYRMNMVKNHYEGYLNNIKVNPGGGPMISAHDFVSGVPALASLLPLVADKEIDSKQTGWGVSPILGAHFSYKGLNIGAKYEFRTALNIENKTVLNKDAGIDSFKDGVNTPHDIPALLTIGASYEILPEKLIFSAGYHRYFDKQAGMSGDKQKALKHGTNEYLAGLEYNINKMFLVSGGFQYTDYGLGDGFQSDLSFYCDSYSLGFGGAINVTDKIQINLAYFWTKYSDYTKVTDTFVTLPGNPPTPIPGAGTEVFGRTNKVFTIGVDFSF